MNSLIFLTNHLVVLPWIVCQTLCSTLLLSELVYPGLQKNCAISNSRPVTEEAAARSPS